MPHLLRHGTYMVISERPVILTSEYHTFGEGAIAPILNVLGLTGPVQAGLEITTSGMLSESTTMPYTTTTCINIL
jgi:hypothetical protein